jgi:NADPH:quinone reductase-like Zn-dependent oxidoreductase
MKAIVFNDIGRPLDVLQLKEIEKPQPKKGEALVRMMASSINPGDFLFMQKLYPAPKWPTFPDQIAGNHGTGVIEEIDGSSCLKAGMLVAFSYYNTWAEYASVPVEWLIPLPGDYNLEKAAQLVNLISAHDLLEKSGVQKNDWLALSAGNSTISMMIAQFARAREIKVISIVRKVNPGMDLKKLGSTIVLESSRTDLKQKIIDITEGKGLNGFIDHVGGLVTGEIIRSMAFGAKVVINGVMSDESYQLHNLDILMNGLEITSYVYRYFFDPPKCSDKTFLNQLVRISGDASFKAPVAQLYPIEQFREAVHASLEQPEKGKRLFQL